MPGKNNQVKAPGVSEACLKMKHNGSETRKKVGFGMLHKGFEYETMEG